MTKINYKYLSDIEYMILKDIKKMTKERIILDGVKNMMNGYHLLISKFKEIIVSIYNIQKLKNLVWFITHPF